MWRRSEKGDSCQEIASHNSAKSRYTAGVIYRGDLISGCILNNMDPRDFRGTSQGKMPGNLEWLLTEKYVCLDTKEAQVHIK